MEIEAWFLSDGATGKRGLLRATVELGPPAPDELVAEPLYGSWEGNMGHALERRPIDICHFRGEDKVVIGNAGVLRVVACGAAVSRFREGDVALLFSGCEPDAHGYPTRILGYDARGAMGCLATRIRIRETNLILIPPETKYSLARWAAFSLRYITAWSNWSLAYRTYRLLVSPEQDAAPNVWGWGGGTTLGVVDLARRNGARAVMLSGNDERLQVIDSLGITGLDRRQFGALQYDEKRFAADAEQRRSYIRAESAFLACVQEMTGGRGVQIFVDNIGGPVIRATQRALSREGIITTCGWKEGMQISYLRAVACIGRQQHINTHYATHVEGEQAVAYAERHGWLPPIHNERIYSFDEIPQLAEDFAANRADLFPLYRVHGGELP